MPTDAPLLLNRREAAGFLRDHCRLPIEPEHLARLAVEGGGPPFHIPGGDKRARALYDEMGLERWAEGYLGPAVTRICEHPSQRVA